MSEVVATGGFLQFDAQEISLLSISHMELVCSNRYHPLYWHFDPPDGVSSSAESFCPPQEKNGERGISRRGELATCVIIPR